MRTRVLLMLLAGVSAAPQEVAAQLDPLLFIKNRTPNVLIVVDTANRMQRDANNDYRDNNIYRKTGAGYEGPLGVTAATTLEFYRRKYINLAHEDPASSAGDRFKADRIDIVGDLDAAAFAAFDERTRIAVARRSLAEAVTRNLASARFGLLRTRQLNPRYLTPASAAAVNWDINEGPVRVALATQSSPTDQGNNGKWLITRPVVDAVNGAVGPTLPLVAPDAAGANASVLDILNKSVGAAGSLIPSGRDSRNTTDAPLDNMLDDAKTEVTRLVNAANAGTKTCCNTVVVLVVGGGEGNTTSEDPAAKAADFLNIGANHRVPVYVIAIAPASTDVSQLRAIATNSGGLYTEITGAMIEATTAGQPVPEFVRAVNLAVQHAYASQADFDTDPTTSLPIGPSTEHQVTSPVIGTVNLVGAKDITGTALPNTTVYHTTTGVVLPQRSNLMITSGFSLPGFDGKIRAFRVYKPVVDSTKTSGYKFSSDGTRLWVASTPPAVADRNIYTFVPSAAGGAMVAFTAANAAALQSHLRASSVTEAEAIIEYVRSQPLGAIVGSTPAIMDPPSLDPPPDTDYPAFANTNKDRRSMIWVGANDGMLHGIDARLGVEVWAYIPYNLLPKLRALRSGQPVGNFRYFVDSSPKVADVKIDGTWRSYLIIGQGAGGTFYQTFDVTLPNMAATVAPTSDTLSAVLSYFAVPTNVPFKWSFPAYSSFNVDEGEFGDLGATATAVEKTVGETWSDPAVGQIQTASGRFVVLAGSGFLKHSVQQQANRGGTIAGTHFYVLDAETGLVLDSRSVGSDGLAETVSDCVAVNDCTRLKNALQADPVATGPADSRYITKAYIGDLDGRLWRFDLQLDADDAPVIASAPTKVYDAGAGHPLFTSMATINVGSTKQYLFQGTGSELLPSNGVSQSYKLLVLLEGATEPLTASIPLEITNSTGGEEKVSSFPAVAGDIVFFATTTYNSDPCILPNGNLYAFTFIGGAAYDTNNDSKLSSADSTRVRTTTGARATAPFIVDQHLVFGTGSNVELFGDENDFNNGVGQAGVRILSWREVR
jgi:hypothetical protein